MASPKPCSGVGSLDDAGSCIRPGAFTGERCEKVAVVRVRTPLARCVFAPPRRMRLRAASVDHRASPPNPTPRADGRWAAWDPS